MSVLPSETREELLSIVRRICKPGKGILAADETPQVMDDQLTAKLGVQNTPENRRRYRQLLFTTARDSISAGLSAVILHDETLGQKLDDGRGFVEAVRDLNLVPGITVDRGLKVLPGGDEGEVFTQGLDDLEERALAYKRQGCDFAKWRMVINVGEDAPSELALETGTRHMALYAAVCQRAGLVPVIEPDLARAGIHTLQMAQRAWERAVAKVYSALLAHGVTLEGTVLKCSMITEGRGHPFKGAPSDVAKATRESLSRCVPCAVPGVFFLSGGLTETDSTVYLNAVNLHGDGSPPPWQLSFCFGRALQDGCRREWGGRDENVSKAQEVFAKRIRLNGMASLGKYPGEG